jgi:hypothetical protein
LATPVVPPVYCSAATLSCVIDTRYADGSAPLAIRAAPAASASGNLVCAYLTGGTIFYT